MANLGMIKPIIMMNFLKKLTKNRQIFKMLKSKWHNSTEKCKNSYLIKKPTTHKIYYDVNKSMISKYKSNIRYQEASIIPSQAFNLINKHL